MLFCTRIRPHCLTNLHFYSKTPISASPFVSITQIATRPQTELSAHVSEKKVENKTRKKKKTFLLQALALKSCGARRLTLAALCGCSSPRSTAQTEKPPCALAGRCSRAVTRRRAAAVTLQRTNLPLARGGGREGIQRSRRGGGVYPGLLLAPFLGLTSSPPTAPPDSSHTQRCVNMSGARGGCMPPSASTLLLIHPRMTSDIQTGKKSFH